MDSVKELMPLVNSIVLTGGEPLLQPKACLELLRRAKKLGLGRGIETNGTNPKALKKILPHLDLIAVDIKAPLADPVLYSKMAGCEVSEETLQKIKESLMIAIGSDAETEARTTIVPTLNDRSDVIVEIAIDVRGVDRYRLQQFRKARTLDPNFKNMPEPSRKDLIKLARVAKQQGLADVRVLTMDGGLEIV